MTGDPRAIAPCTPMGIITILKHCGLQDLEGKKVTIIRRRKKEMVQQIISSDIFISAIGQPNYFNQRFFVEHIGGVRLDEPLIGAVCPVAIDVGIDRNEDGKLCGDISKDLHKYFSWVTPVPNGAGRTTVLSVVQNIQKCWEVQNSKHR